MNIFHKIEDYAIRNYLQRTLIPVKNVKIIRVHKSYDHFFMATINPKNYYFIEKIDGVFFSVFPTPLKYEDFEKFKTYCSKRVL